MPQAHDGEKMGYRIEAAEIKIKKRRRKSGKQILPLLTPPKKKIDKTPS
ncbi:MAG: hypothetical protein LBS39_03485 [Campylobacteraceae bacterium]|jgi:hypothetical protein|nr:hypothetical protein [Campylobacteraceae bacterium]